MSDSPPAVAMSDSPPTAATTGDSPPSENKEREVWSSRTAFYFAAIGAAVGFGNVWRFPSLSVDYGGGAFFIPYLLALFFIGIPLGILEIGFGQYFQTGDVGVFGGFHPRLRGVGLSSVACGFMLDTYYVVLVAWVVNAFFDSWSSSSPWEDEDNSASKAIDYFVNDVIGAGTLGEDGRPTRIVARNVGFSALIWVIVFLCCAFGIKWTGRLTYFTMGLPILLLFIFVGKAASLEGSEDGINEYIGIWDMSVLTERGDVWSVACSQIFFSIGITFGILTAFGSHCERNEPAVWNSCVIAISNSIFSFIAGFAVFAALGHLAWKEGVEVTDLPYSGFGLVFGTWPVVFNELPGGIHWVRLLFFDLFLLGIDSAFAFQEAFITVLKDTIYFEHVARWKLALGMSLVGFLFSLIYCTDAGLNFLDVIDFYINFVMLIVGFFEAFGSAWVYGMVDQIELLGREAVCSYMVATFGAVFLGSGLWFGLKENEVWGGFVGMFAFYFAGLGVTGFFLSKRLAEDTENKWTMKSMWWELSMGNILSLRDRIQPVIGPVPFVWCLLMKHFIPQVLIILFINLAQTDNGLDGTPKFGNYGGYENRPFQALGMLSFFFALFLFVNGLIFPDLYAPLALPQVKEAEADFTITAARDAAGAEKEKGASDSDKGDEEDSPKGVKDEEDSPKDENDVAVSEHSA